MPSDKTEAPKSRRSRSRYFSTHPDHHKNRFQLPIAAQLMLGLAFLIVLGACALWLTSLGTDNPLTYTETIFTAVSALTVTGLSLIVPSVDLSIAGQVVLLIMIQIGGVGFMFIIVVLLRALGRQIHLRNRLALTNSLGLESQAEILKLLQRVLVGVLAIEGIGALLLWLNWLRYFSPGKALCYAIFHAISAFCNAGFDLFNGATDKYGNQFEGIPTDNISLAILGSIILIGGLGIPVIAELIDWKDRKRYSINTRLTIFVVLGLTLFGWVGLFVSEAFRNGVLVDEPLMTQLMQSLFQSISNRTAGFAGLPQFGRLQSGSTLLIMTMMYIGCAPASMGGGITTGTFSVLLVSLKSYIRGERKPRVFGRAIDNDTVQRAGAILTISVVLVLSATWLLVLTHPHLTLEQTVFEVVSAFATCGLSLGITGEFNAFGRVIIMLLMFWGRLGPMTVVLAVGQRQDAGPQLLQYPEESILIG